MNLCPNVIQSKCGLKLVLNGNRFSNILELFRNEFRARPVCEDKGQAPPVVDAGITVHCNVIYIAKSHAGFRQAVLNRFSRKTGPMLDTAEALFLRSSNELFAAN